MTPALRSPSSLTVRRLGVDLSQGFSRHWNGGDAFVTAFCNALSMSFPVGEQYFIDSVRGALKALPEAQRNRFAVVVDELGSVCGVVTLEDVLETLVSQLGDPDAWPRDGSGTGEEGPA